MRANTTKAEALAPPSSGMTARAAEVGSISPVTRVRKQDWAATQLNADDKVRLDYNDFVFDINDYLLSHSMHRISILRKDGHEVVVKDKLEF